MTDFQPDFDLLGDPVPPNFGKRGRPQHVPTDEKRRLVKQLLAFDWSLEKIAAALSITPPTLKRHYFRQLKFQAEARARVEAKLLNELMKQAEAGNVSAIEKYFKRLDRHDMRRESERMTNAKPTAAPKLGKKEAARQAANEVTGAFAPPEPPRLVN